VTHILTALTGTTKHYKAQELTNLGFEQNFQVGSSYRARYLDSASPNKILGISEFTHTPSQIYASAPDQKILLNTATAFLQGFYPPSGSLRVSGQQKLNNGTTSAAPLNGYQYVTLSGVNTNSPDTVWLKGADGCPAMTVASKDYKTSTEFKSQQAATKDFYAGFYPFLSGVFDYKPDMMTYANAYDIFDLINVALVHNSSFKDADISAEQLYQLRTLGDASEFAANYNQSASARAIGGQTFMGGVFKQLNQTVNSRGKLKFSLLSGSYNTFLSFFGLASLTSASSDFFGLPHYAATMAFELFTSANMSSFPSDVADLKVRFLFRNGSNPSAPLTTYPLFGMPTTDMSWLDFEKEMKSRAIMTTAAWCQACGNVEGFCLESGWPHAPFNSFNADGLTNAAAGAIGAAVTLAVVGSAAILAFLAVRRKSRAAEVQPTKSDSMSITSAEYV